MTSWPGLVRTEKKKSKWSGLKKTKQGDSLERIRMGLGWWRGQNTERKEKSEHSLVEQGRAQVCSPDGCCSGHMLMSPPRLAALTQLAYKVLI